jgi:hypothetical protein
MAVMWIIMMLPAFGLALFYFRPLASALPRYLVLLAFSGFFHVLMMKSKRRYVGTGPEALVGAPAVVLSWKDRSGQVPGSWGDLAGAVEERDARQEGRRGFRLAFLDREDLEVRR